MDYSGEPSGESDFSEDLDNDFRRILCVIKQYIPYINSNYQLSLYRSWLEKLSSADCEKTERNKYLLELARQIKNNNLLPPFNMPPPTGSLRCLPKITHFRSTNFEASPQVPEDIAGTVFNEETHRALFEPLYSSQQLLKESQRTRYTPTPAPVKCACDIPNHSSFMDSPESYYFHPNYADEDVDDVFDEKSKPKTKKRKSKTGRGLQKSSADNFPQEPSEKFEKGTDKVFIKPPNSLPVVAPPETDVATVPLEPDDKILKDDSSWCDLTDASMTSVNVMGSGDAEKNKPIVLQKPQKLNEILRVLEQPTTDIDKFEAGHEELEDIQSNFTAEVDSLKRKMQVNINNEATWVVDTKVDLCKQDITEVKLGLKDTNFISMDWKKTIEALQLRLTETLNQNNELKSIINALQTKIKEEQKSKDQNDNKAKKPQDMHKKEIEALQQIQIDNIKKLESSFQVKLSEAEKNYQQKIDKLRIGYENQIEELRMEHENTKKAKDMDMCRLSEIIKQQCIRMSNEIAALRNQIEYSFTNNNSDEKIVVLQKCVSKMDKLFLRSEKEYQKQLEKLKHELDLKDKVVQIQLKTQRAELITRTSAEKQRQFDDVVNTLEIKYIKMLEYHEAQVMETKQQDERKIEKLISLLDENDIPHDIV